MSDAVQPPALFLEDKYELLGKLREGGMGAIYKVRHRYLDRVRVIKVMRPKTAASEELRKRFLREAQTATELRHPNIVTFYDYFVDGQGAAYMVMEFLEGVNVQELVRKHGPMPLPLGVLMLRQSLAALGYLHRRGIVHRDISPDNIMFTRDSDGSCLFKLIDLGIARLPQATEELTAAGEFLGKLRYSSPEQLTRSANDPDLDGRSDLYSLCAVLYEALTGICPFRGESLYEILSAHLKGRIVAFDESDRLGRIPAGFRELLERGLRTDPNQRFQSAEETAARLDAISRDVPADEAAVANYVAAATSETGVFFEEALTGSVPRPSASVLSPPSGPQLPKPPAATPTPKMTPTVLETAPASDLPFTGTVRYRRPAAGAKEGAVRPERPAAKGAVQSERLPRSWPGPILLVAAAVVLLGVGAVIVWNWQGASPLSQPVAPTPVPVPTEVPNPPPSLPVPQVGAPRSISQAEHVDLPTRVESRAPKLAPVPPIAAPVAAPAIPKIPFCAIVDRTSYQQDVVRGTVPGFASDVKAFRPPRGDAGRITIEVAVSPERPLEGDPFAVAARFENGGDEFVKIEKVEESAIREAGGFKLVTGIALPTEVGVGGSLEIFRFQGVAGGTNGFSKELRVTDWKKDAWRTTIRLAPCPDR